MRPWLLLPLLLPGLWAGLTYADLWPADTPEVLLHPLAAIVGMIFGLVAAIGLNRLMGDNAFHRGMRPVRDPRPRRRGERKGDDAAAEDDAPPVEALVWVEDEPAPPVPELHVPRQHSGVIPARRAASTWSTGRVEMPDKVPTATPAPRAG